MKKYLRLLSLFLALSVLLANANYSNAKKAKFSKKKVTYQATKCSDRIIVRLANKNGLDASVDITIRFYDENNKMIDAADLEGCVVEKKYVAFQEFAKWKDDYYSYKIKISSKEYKNYNLCGSKIKYTKLKTDDSIKIIVKNKFKKSLTVVATVLFYKDGKMVSMSKSWFWDVIGKKKSKVIEVDIPNDPETYENVGFDSYKVYLNGYRN